MASARSRRAKKSVRLDKPERKSVPESDPSVALLVVCVCGIYGSFLTWSYLQEKLSSKNYGTLEAPAIFRSPLVLNIVQSILAMLVGTVYLSIKKGSATNPMTVLRTNRALLPRFLLIALAQAVAAPLAYQSLNHVDYLFYLLAKSCKLIPVMLVHYIFYGSRFTLSKYLVATVITLGVVIFTMGSSTSKATHHDGQTWLGLAQLMASLALDGYVNSTQDQVFKFAKRTGTELTGAHLMAILNLLNATITTIYMLVATSEYTRFESFVETNGLAALYDVVGFGILGALGQIFIFITLEKFSSIVLVTATVTRKMLSMCLSVLLFGHLLKLAQWVGLSLVFAGILSETASKLSH